jgi:hypothetical protein
MLRERSRIKVTVGMRGYEVFIGYPLLIFAVVGVVVVKDRLLRIAALLATCFFVLSLGPTLKVFGSDTGMPLPYAWLMKVPPFDFSRTPGRFVVLGLFFLAPTAAAGMSWMRDAISRRFGPASGLAAMLAVFSWTVGEAYAPLPHQPVFVPPAQLTGMPSGPVLNLPLSAFD